MVFEQSQNLVPKPNDIQQKGQEKNQITNYKDRLKTKRTSTFIYKLTMTQPTPKKTIYKLALIKKNESITNHF